MENVPNLDFFLVRNKEGKWFRRKGYGGSGDTWVDEIKRARVYARLGPARGIVTFFVNHYDPKYGVPDIVHFKAEPFEVINESERVKKAKEQKDAADAKRKAADAKWRLEAAEKAFEAAKKDLASAKRKKP
jgi:hypothetical protein